MISMNDSPETIWEKVTESLRESFPQETFELWFSSTKARAFTESILHIEVPNRYFCEWMEKNKEEIDGAVRKVTSDSSCAANFVINEDNQIYRPQSREELPEPVYEPGSETSFPESDLNPRYTFESFVIGTANRFAQATAEAIANDPGSRYNPLFLYGGVGLGKTHLLHAIGHRIKSSDPTKKVLYVTCEKFTQEYIDGIRGKSMPDFQRKYLNVSVLLIDDIQFLEKKEGVQEAFFHIFNNLIELRRQVVISSDKSPDRIKTLEERLRSRFQWGVIADIQPPDLETRIAILKSKAEREELDIPDDVLLFIATNIKDNVRKLEGAMTRICAFCSLMGSDVTVDNARQILKDVISAEAANAPVSVSKIQEEVSNYYHIQVKDLKSKKRTKNLVFPRHLAMYIARKLTEKSTTEIGSEFGGRDHTTVMYACKAVGKKVENDPYFRSLVNKLTSKIRAGTGSA